jgi:hypothetical protein
MWFNALAHFCCCCLLVQNITEPYYLPTWQAVPVVPRYPAYNWDLLADPSTDTSIFNTSRVSITPAYLIYVEGNDELNERNEIEADWFKDYLLPGEEPMEPVSDIFYPVLANAADHVSTRNKTGSNNVVAILALSVYWRNELKNILPTGANGVDVVFENPCSPTFTYRLNGPTAVYRGSGDVHDMEYSSMGTSAKLLELRDHAFGSGRAYTGVPFSQDYCPFTIIVYPSAVLHDTYTTSTPMMFTIAALIIFLFTSAVFVFYDIMVERRQKLVLSTATKTSAIVSSLFPSKVRAELMKEQDELERERERAAAVVESPKRRLKTFLLDNDGNRGRGLPISLPMGNGYTSKPLAELYADTTVFFGDIAGFTAWSKSGNGLELNVQCHLAISHIVLVSESKVRPATLHRFSLFSKPCMENLMQSLEEEVCSRSKRLAIRTLQYVVSQSLGKSMLLSWPSLPLIAEARRIRFVKNSNLRLDRELPT